MDEFKFDSIIPNNSEKQKSPLESLKERMLGFQSNNKNSIDASPAGFTVSKPDEEKKQEAEHISTQNNDENKTLFEIDNENNEDLSESSDAIVEEDDENVTEPDEEIKPEETLEDSKPVSEKHPSFLHRIKRYTTDDNGVDVTENSEPLYTLDSVNSILGIEQTDTEDDSDEEESAEENLLEEEKAVTPYISDIDKPIDDTVSSTKSVDDTATIRFTPISDDLSQTTTVNVDMMTKRIDLGDELTETTSSAISNEEQFEKSDFEQFVPEEEINSSKDEKKYLRLFAIKKRKTFLISCASGFLCFLLLIGLFPTVTNSMIFEPKLLMIIALSILGLIIVANIGMFKSLKGIRSGSLSNDVNISLASISTVILAVFSIMKNVDTFPIIFICGFILFVRSLMTFYSASNMYDNLKIISVPRPKKAVTLIGDTQTAVAIAKSSVEGDVLIASSRQTSRVADYLKYSNYGDKLFGKSTLVITISILLSVGCGLVSGFLKHSVVEGLYLSSTVLCITALPILFLIDTLPLRSMTSHLNKKGAMMTGYTAAEQINTANAVVIKSSDLFPSGTIVLKDMKVLSNASVDDIILRAASLTDAIGSPLSSIFKRIAKTNAAYDVPDSDTVKYEERLGISGWVHNERLFIGNRTLMQAHGIEVPDLEVDRAILKSGCFPVYVAKDSKACVLLIIKYSVDPDVAAQLKEATMLGITVLVDNSDPNLTSEMICDYFSLYENSVYVMTGVGSNVHKAATAPMDECSAGAAYKGNTLSLLHIMSCAAKLKRSNTVLALVYCVAAVFGIIYFVYTSFLSGTTLIERASTLLIYEIAATAVSLLAFLFKRP